MVSSMDEIRDVQPMDEYEEVGRRRITAGPVIAVIVVVLILSIAGFYFFYGAGEVKEVTVIFGEEYFKDGNIEGVTCRVFVTPVGVRSYTGSGTVDVFFNGKLEHSGSVDIKKDEESFKLPYRDFVVENGEYEIKCTIGEKSGSFMHEIYHIPESVSAVLSLVGEGYDQKLNITMYPVFSKTLTKNIQIVNVNKNYRYSYEVTDESGYKVTGNYLSYELDPNNKIVSRELDMDLMGNYTVEVSLETLLMKENVEGRTVTMDPFVTYINRAPIIEVSASSTSVRPGTEVTFSLKGDDLDSNGQVLYYNLVLPDADGDGFEELETYYYEGPTTRVRYTFENLGTYNVTFTAVDNGPVIGTGDDIQLYQEFSPTKWMIIEVKWLG